MELRVFTEPQEGASYEDLLAVARTAEECGFGAFFRSDHYLAFSGDGLPGPTDAWVTLAGLARETSTIRLGTLVTAATFRHPGPLAISVAQVDRMSGGRVELGLGAGWFAREHEAYGLDFPPVKERFDRYEEQLAVVTGLLGTPLGASFSYEGEHYRVVDSPALPKPAQEHVPVIVGGGGKQRTPRLAAHHADEFNMPFAALDTVEAQFGRVRAACEAVDRDPATMTFSAALTVAVGADDAEVERRAVAAGGTAERLRADGVAGTPDEVVETLQRWAAIGCERVYLQVMDLHDLDHLRLVAEEVLPRVR
ncbi:LLM class F420-dependent oxidoreductase [Aquipuribacter nitratireducens]|uniref:LLM class F420-dependent oxidoreductase n=1 Tax=Aquipuribacter nitratireducens TaxID=650104 RepID=A0ABW0GL83_9MICO